MKAQQFESTNPATGEVFARYSECGQKELDQLLREATLVSSDWRARPLPERAKLVQRLGQELLRTRDELARLVTQEMGKPLTQARAEIEKCARLCDYYASQGNEFLAPQAVSGNEAARSYVRFDPLGVVLAIMPWNFPFWQVFRFAVPALLAGNVGLLKHATNVLGCAAAIERLFRDAGFPSGTFAAPPLGRERTEQLIASDLVRAVALTGSEGAGRSVAQAAGKSLKKCVLELGGSDPFIVLPDADLSRALEQAVLSRTLNNGQSCIAAKRFIVHADVYEEFVEGMTARMESLIVTDPLSPDCDLGPLAREDLRQTLQDQVSASLADGATLCTGGAIPEGRGWFYPPTVLGNVEPGMTAFSEETFGPVAAVVRADDEQTAIKLANHSSFGLGASVWTTDVQRAERAAAQLQAGCVFINELVKSDPSVPFGGVKNSGYGRELGEFGIREFVNIKTVWVGR